MCLLCATNAFIYFILFYFIFIDWTDQKCPANRTMQTFFFRCDQAALKTLLSVCLSVCPSARPSVTPFSPCSCHRIMKFSGVITIDISDVHAKGQGQRSKVKVTEVKKSETFICFRTVTPVWVHIYEDEMMRNAWCCLGEGPYCFSRSSVKFQGLRGQKMPIST